ncbi:MAG: HAD hydrolase family protein, partial [Peptostreptococcus sp.]
VVFGDNTNDIKMFRPEWTSIAMGNAVEELKKIADFVTKDADDGGIEHACRHFGWID